MNIKNFYFFFIILSLLNFLSCNESAVDDSNYTALSYISHKNSGCLPGSSGLSEEKEAVIELIRKGFNFNVILNFSTLCDASFKDSVSISSNKISICLLNENPGTLCICPYKDEFNFKIIKGGEFKISFYLKNSFISQYHLVADTAIAI